MILSEPKSESDLTVCVRRHPSGGQTAGYRFSDIDGSHRRRVSDGGGRETSPGGLFGYVMCDGAVSGAVAHSCRHGPAPHRIKVCIPKTCNKEDWKAIEVAVKTKGSCIPRNSASFATSQERSPGSNLLTVGIRQLLPFLAMKPFCPFHATILKQSRLNLFS